MNFEQSIKSGFGNYANFSSRSEFWWFTLFITLLKLLVVAPGILKIIGLAASLIVLVPSVSIGVRRLHDVGRSGWWLLISITIIGMIPLLYWYIRDSDPEENQYGPRPRGTPSEGRTS